MWGGGEGEGGIGFLEEDGVGAMQLADLED